MNERRLAQRCLVLPIVAALLLIAPPRRPSAAAEIEKVQFPDHYQFADVMLDLHCVGLLRYRLFIKAYVAALYLRPDTSPEDVFTDVPKRLELSYFWSLRAADIAQAGDQMLAQNVDADTFDRLRPKLDQINALYVDVKPGDRYSLTYVPGLGTELALNGKRRGVIEGADFAAAYYRIWLGTHPIDTALRDQLLACANHARDHASAGTVRRDTR